MHSIFVRSVCTCIGCHPRSLLNVLRACRFAYEAKANAKQRAALAAKSAKAAEPAEPATA